MIGGVRSVVAASVASALALGCQDVVVGGFALDGSSSGAAESTGGGTLMPGECVVEAFDADPLDPDTWVMWADDDASVAVSTGALTFVPPTTSERGTGLVLNNSTAFAFDPARARVEVITPPDPSSDSEVFLQVTQQVPLTTGLLGIGLRGGMVTVTAVRDDGTMPLFEVVATTVPRWIGIRTEGGTAYYEQSDDGITWTVLTTIEQPSSFAGATPLVMVWNNAGAGVADPQPVVVDNFSICAD